MNSSARYSEHTCSFTLKEIIRFNNLEKKNSERSHRQMDSSHLTGKALR